MKSLSTYLFQMSVISWNGCICLFIIAVVALCHQCPKSTIALVCAATWLGFSGAIYGTESRLQRRREQSRRPRIHL